MIADRGTGMTVKPGLAGLGLTSIKERTRVLNGSLIVVSRPDEDTTRH